MSRHDRARAVHRPPRRPVKIRRRQRAREGDGPSGGDTAHRVEHRIDFGETEVELLVPQDRVVRRLRIEVRPSAHPMSVLVSG